MPQDADNRSWRKSDGTKEEGKIWIRARSQPRPGPGYGPDKFRANDITGATDTERPQHAPNTYQRSETGEKI